MNLILIAIIFFANQVQADTWSLNSGRLEFTAKHPLKTTHGVSESVKGKAACEKGTCDVLVGVPVNTFNSGDSNRDLHMMQVTKGASFPLITAKTKFKEEGFLKNGSLKADFEVRFAGQTIKVEGVPLKVEEAESGARKVSGIFPLSLKAFSIVSPSLLGMSIEDQIPVQFTSVWKR
jgi:hypothetical protein